MKKYNKKFEGRNLMASIKKNITDENSQVLVSKAYKYHLGKNKISKFYIAVYYYTIYFICLYSILLLSQWKLYSKR